MVPSVLLAALLAMVAAAAPNGGKVSTKVESKQTCITKFRTAQYMISPLPTQTRTSTLEVSSTVTSYGEASTTIVTVTPDAVTSTLYYNATNSFSSSNVLAKVHAKVPAACSITTTISFRVATLYTGAYDGTNAERTASPLDLNQPVDERPNTETTNTYHLFGQSVVGPRQNEMAVDCLNEVTTYYITTLTTAEWAETETATAVTPTVYITQAKEGLPEPTVLVSISTTMNAPIVETATNGVCTVTSAKSTTTQHMKCAPTNLISSINGKGIGLTGGDSANTRSLVPGSDPSACCQLCVDDKDCAASEDDPDAGNCFLWYTTPSCGLGFRYSDGGQNLRAGSGFLVQTGCGTMEAVDSF